MPAGGQGCRAGERVRQSSEDETVDQSSGASGRIVVGGGHVQVPARRREERGCGPVTGKDRASCQSGNFQGIVMVQFSLRLGTGFISAHHWILKFHMILYSIHNIVY